MSNTFRVRAAVKKVASDEGRQVRELEPSERKAIERASSTFRREKSFIKDHEPLVELIGSPTKPAALACLSGLALGAAMVLLGRPRGTRAWTWVGGTTAVFAVGLPLMTWANWRSKNAKVEEAMTRLPKGATIEDVKKAAKGKPEPAAADVA